MPYRRLLAASLLVAAFALIGVTLALPHLRVLAVAVALASQDRSGQTFFTWQGQPGVAVRYRIYRHAHPDAHANRHKRARCARLPGDPQRDNQ